MTKAMDIYGPHDGYSTWCSYQPMVDSFGNVLIQVDDDDYQGDTRVLYEKGGKYGLLIFGWGSCSGCDRLQDCDSVEELQELIDDTEASIKWFDDLDEFQKWVMDRDWETQYSWHADGTKEFISRALAYKVNQ
jgi:hypothetical protein